MKNGVLTLFSMWKLVLKSKSSQRPLIMTKKKFKVKILYDETLSEAHVLTKLDLENQTR